MSRFTLHQISKLSPALQAQVMADQARALKARGLIMTKAGIRADGGAPQPIPIPPAKSHRKPVPVAKQAIPEPISNAQQVHPIPGNAPRPVRRSAKRRPAANPPVDAGLLHPIAQQVPGKTLECHPSPQSGGTLSPARRPQVHFTLYRVALLDPDNKWASVKFLLDAMRYAGLIPNDRECDIELIVSQQRVPTRAQEGTGVEILYPSVNTPRTA